ncbi:hypothetical protein HU200_051111 [Digitaria exilis]|uniref:Uncharacterized protein n=1 Tax=Digitaria exilis TaxID=1010633 RepID=A0A835AN68_9POAL|nr:hypothetical protein HU200_051111 [Digitaria exilis]
MSSLYERKSENLLLCMPIKCSYFGSEDFCYCCPNSTRKEYCHLRSDECADHCHICKPNC